MAAVRVLRVLAVAVWVAGCAAGVPEPIRDGPADPVAWNDAVERPEQVEGAAVRWGGRIVSVRHEEEATWLEVVARPLERRGRPRDVDQSDGRFLARTEAFLDPSIHEAGREVTVRGGLAGVRDGRVGEFRYTYPVVEAEVVHLWPERGTEGPDARYHGRGYDPWCDPWHPRFRGYRHCRW